MMRDAKIEIITKRPKLSIIHSQMLFFNSEFDKVNAIWGQIVLTKKVPLYTIFFGT